MQLDAPSGPFSSKPQVRDSYTLRSPYLPVPALPYVQQDEDRELLVSFLQDHNHGGLYDNRQVQRFGTIFCCSG